MVAGRPLKVVRRWRRDRDLGAVSTAVRNQVLDTVVDRCILTGMSNAHIIETEAQGHALITRVLDDLTGLSVEPGNFEKGHVLYVTDTFGTLVFRLDAEDRWMLEAIDGLMSWDKVRGAACTEGGFEVTDEALLDRLATLCGEALETVGYYR